MSGFAAEFLGCKVSMTDAQEIRERLTEAGHAEVDPERARVRVVNTCCVTAEAVAKSRKAVRRAARTAIVAPRVRAAKGEAPQGAITTPHGSSPTEISFVTANVRVSITLTEFERPLAT